MSPIVFEDSRFRVEQCLTCPLPGYLMLYVKGGCQSLADLDPEQAGQLGTLLARAARAIEAVVPADRIYTMMFAEVLREVHFHLFPRTQWLLDGYWRATGSQGQPIDGPALFQWARERIGPGAMLEPGALTAADAIVGLRAELTGQDPSATSGK